MANTKKPVEVTPTEKVIYTAPGYRYAVQELAEDSGQWVTDRTFTMAAYATEHANAQKSLFPNNEYRVLDTQYVPEPEIPSDEGANDD